MNEKLSSPMEAYEYFLPPKPPVAPFKTSLNLRGSVGFDEAKADRDHLAWLATRHAEQEEWEMKRRMEWAEFELKRKEDLEQWERKRKEQIRDVEGRFEAGILSGAYAAQE